MEKYSDALRRLAEMLDDDFEGNCQQVADELRMLSRFVEPSPNAGIVTNCTSNGEKI
jgi:hypothetical protein